MTFVRRIIPFCFLLFFCSSLGAQTIYVDQSASGLNDGTSWANAFTNLDSAFVKLKQITVDTIKLAQGTYKPGLLPDGSIANSRDAVFYLETPLVIYGGYSHGGGNRDFRLYPTILSGDLGVVNDISDNAFHVLIIRNADCTLDGVCIKDGNADGQDSLAVFPSKISRQKGAGLFCDGASIAWNNVIIKNNSGISGSGLYLQSSTALFNASFFLNNNAVMDAGAIESNASILTIMNGVFFQNVAQRSAGAIYNYGSGNFSMYHSTLVSNACYLGNGGAVYSKNMQLSQIANCLFSLNYVGASSNTWLDGADIKDSIPMTQASNCLFQSYAGGTDCIVSEEAWLINPLNPYGADGFPATADDGLKITPASQAFNAGANAMSSVDITDYPRGSSFDIGAYETGACSYISNRTVYVDSMANGANNGSSWQNAFTQLQSALSIAAKGCVDTIKVAKGTYYPINPPPVANTNDKCFYMYDNLTLLGGYSSGGGQRNASQYPSVLNGTNSITKHVVIIADKQNVLLDGFTITGGDADGSPLSFTINSKSLPNDAGGGILVANSKATIQNCKIENNRAASFGGAISSQNSLLMLTSCTVKSNQTYSSNFQLASGGGLYITQSQVGTTIKQTVFENNTTIYSGAGIYLFQAPAPVNVDSCSFIKNICSMNLGNANGGGAIATDDHSVLIATHSLFDQNKGHQGGAVFCGYLTQNTFNSCVFTNNSSYRDGGGVHVRSSYTADLINCLFVQNKSAEYGGGLYMGANTGIYFCNFLKNEAQSGAGIYNASSINIANTIFWKNTINGSTTSAGTDVSGPLQNAHNNLWQVYSGTSNGNIVGVDPQFADTSNAIGPDNLWGTADDGLELTGSSPLFNQGSASTYFPTAITQDIKGSPRVQCNVVDIGAYERTACNQFTNHTVYVDSSAVNGNKSGVDWQNAFTDIQSALNVMTINNLDTMKIARGTYYPPSTGLDIGTGMSLIGGYPNGGGTPDFKSHPVLLDGTNVAAPTMQIIGRSNVSLEGFTIQNAKTPVGGGGLTAKNSSFKMTNLRFRNCSSNSTIYFSNCTGSFSNCAVYDNTGFAAAAGILNESSPVKYTNCVFSNNHNQGLISGAVKVSSPGLPSFVNCTFYKNSGGYGGALSSDSTPFVRNCVFWGNTSYTASQAGYIRELGDVNHFIGANVSNCLFEFPTQAPVSNCFIGVNPGFANSSNPAGVDGIFGTVDDGLVLSSGSIAINKGLRSWLPSGVTTDITGNARTVMDSVDLGAYETDCGFSTQNILAPLGSLQQVNTVQDACGSIDYVQTPSNPAQYMVMIDANGNTFSPTSVTVDATNNLNQVSSDGIGNSTALAYRMVSIIAPGNFALNNGIKVRIYYDPAEFAGMSNSFRSWFKHPAHSKQDVLAALTPYGLQNATYLTPTSQGVQNGIAYVQFDSITSFSTFGYLAKTFSSPLPVTFLSFTATLQNATNFVSLHWITASERNNQKFGIQRSADGINWKTVGYRIGSGNSSQEQNYNWIDSLPLDGWNYYRLEQINADGTIHYSTVSGVTIKSVPGTVFLYPNPARNQVTVVYSKMQPDIQYELFDAAGRMVLRGERESVKEFSIQLYGIRRGAYILRLNNEHLKIRIIE
jgi:hypothetical protein